MTSLIDRLKATCPQAWHTYTHHPFVEQLGNGSLPEKAFRYYLKQDYLFLIQFARAYALAGYKAKSLADLNRAKDGLSAILDIELGLHIGFCQKWGISPQDLDSLEEDTHCMAYTRYVLERGMAGDLLDLHIALAPCMLGYGEIGKRLSQTASSDTPYADWIKMYSSADYQSACEEELIYIEKRAGTSLSEQRFAELAKTFDEATRLEIGFWQMGLDAA